MKTSILASVLLAFAPSVYASVTVSTGVVSPASFPGIGTIIETNLASGAVTETKIADAAVTEIKIATGAVTETRIATGSVTSGKLSGDITPPGRLMVPMGEISYFNMTGTLITIGSASDGSTNMVLVAPPSTFTATSEEFTVSSNGRLKYTGSVTRMFHIALTVSGTPANSNDVFVLGVAKGGTVYSPSKVVGSSAGTQFSSIHAYISLATNDYIELYIGNTSAGRNFTVKSLNIFSMGM